MTSSPSIMYFDFNTFYHHAFPKTWVIFMIPFRIQLIQHEIQIKLQETREREERTAKRCEAPEIILKDFSFYFSSIPSIFGLNLCILIAWKILEWCGIHDVILAKNFIWKVFGIFFRQYWIELSKFTVNYLSINAFLILPTSLGTKFVIDILHNFLIIQISNTFCKIFDLIRFELISHQKISAHKTKLSSLYKNQFTNFHRELIIHYN